MSITHPTARLTMTILALTVAAAAPAAFQKPPSAPVKVEYTVPPDVKTGDQVTTVITFRALADCDRVDVSIAPFEGVELLSEPQSAVFTNVRRGDGPQLTATVRLTAPKFGSLAVSYTVHRGRATASGAISIVYGNPD